MIDFHGQAQAEIMKRLERYDRVCEFVVTYDPTCTDCTDGCFCNGYVEGAEVVLDELRELLGMPKGGDE